jgi:hypothetical protein
MPNLLNQIGVIPQWLRTLLRLQGEQVPNRLDTSALYATIDAYQGGWASADFRTIGIAPTAYIANTVEVLIPADTTRTRLITSLSVDFGSPGAAMEMWLHKIHAVVGGSIFWHVSQGVTPTIGYFTWSDIVGGGPYMILEAGYNLSYQIDQNLLPGPVGNAVTMRATWIECPIGFKLI